MRIERILFIGILILVPTTLCLVLPQARSSILAIWGGFCGSFATLISAIDNATAGNTSAQKDPGGAPPRRVFTFATSGVAAFVFLALSQIVANASN